MMQEEINIQDVLPLVEAVRNQNEIFKTARQQLEQSLEKVSALTKHLHKENEELRQHYQQRALDLQRVVVTITNNYEHDLSELKHTNFLVRRRNTQLVRKIERQMANLQNERENMVEEEKKLQELHHEQTRMEHQLLNRAAHNRQLEYRIEVLQQQQPSETDIENNELLAQVIELQKINQEMATKLYRLQRANRENRPKYLQGTKLNSKVVSQTKQSMEQLSEEANTQEKEAQRLSKERDQAYQVMNEAFSLKERERLRYDKLSQELRESTTNVRKVRSTIPETVEKIQKERQKSENLSEVIGDKRKILAEARRRHDEQTSEQTKEHNAVKSQLLSSLRDQQIEQIAVCGLLKEKSAQAQREATTFRDEYSSLVELEASLSNKLKNMHDPVKQIVKLELLVRQGRRNN